MPHGQKTLTDVYRIPVSMNVTFQSGGCSPKISTLLAMVRNHQLAVGPSLRNKKIFLYDIGLVARVQHEIAMPILAAKMHNMGQKGWKRTEAGLFR
jgi:hypothetical protein